MKRAIQWISTGSVTQYSRPMGNQNSNEECLSKLERRELRAAGDWKYMTDWDMIFETAAVSE
jgi:hypothetical protein